MSFPFGHSGRLHPSMEKYLPSAQKHNLGINDPFLLPVGSAQLMRGQWYAFLNRASGKFINDNPLLYLAGVAGNDPQEANSYWFLEGPLNPDAVDISQKIKVNLRQVAGLVNLKKEPRINDAVILAAADKETARREKAGEKPINPWAVKNMTPEQMMMKNRISRANLDYNLCYAKVKKGSPEEYVGRFARSYSMGSGNGKTLHWEFDNNGKKVTIDDEMWGSVNGNELIGFRVVPCQNKSTVQNMTPEQMMKNRISRANLDSKLCYAKVKKGLPEEYVGRFVRSYSMGSGNGKTLHWEFDNKGKKITIDDEMWGSVNGNELIGFRVVPCQKGGRKTKKQRKLRRNRTYSGN
jgi:hypothetical protein